MARRRAHSREQRRGAAFVEALIAAVAFTIVLACVVFAHELMLRKDDTLRRARYGAWNATRAYVCDVQTGTDEREIALPAVMVQAGGQLRSHTVRSGLSMACNEQPDEHDDLIAVLLWTGRTTATEVVSVVGDSVAHLFGLRR